jgi:hypothetical protein
MIAILMPFPDDKMLRDSSLDSKEQQKGKGRFLFAEQASS